MGGGDKAEKAEKARVKAEKNAARAEQRKAAVARAEDAHRLAPAWLRQLAASFRDCAMRLAGNDETDELLERCRLHEQRLATIVKKIDGKLLTADAANDLRDGLEYMLELLEDPEANTEALEAADDEDLYSELKTNASSRAESAPAPPQEAEDVMEPTGYSEADVIFIRKLDFAESHKEIQKALLEAVAHEGGLIERGADATALTASVASARAKLRRLKSATDCDAKLAEAARRETRTNGAAATLESAVAVAPPIDQAAAEPSSSSSGGRIVLNHSTHCPGLLHVLRRLRKSPLVKTCVPGPLHQVQAHVGAFELRVQRADAAAPDGSGGACVEERVKCVARNWRTAQDVELLLPAGLRVPLSEIEDAISEAICPSRAAEACTYDQVPLEPGGRLNLTGAEAVEQRRQKQCSRYKAEHEKGKARAKQKEREELEKQKERKLASSAAAREKGIDLKSHAKQWAAAETGEASLGKYWGGGRAKRDVS